jgi:hypothetical protein
MLNELAYRENDGITVTLHFDTTTEIPCIEVTDTRTDSVQWFDVTPATALDAFYHPFAYMNSGVACAA